MGQDNLKNFTSLYIRVGEIIDVLDFPEAKNPSYIIKISFGKEIGIRKAIGAHPGSIVSQIILESTLLTAFSGYVGFVLAVAVIETLSSLMEGEGGMFQNPEINFNVAIIATVVLIISGALAGFIPAKRAASINPVIALRGE